MYIVSDELYHHGIQGQKWGLRRYQNSDGSLTEAGRVRYRGLAGKVRYAKDMAKDASRKHKQKKALAKARKTKEENKKAAEKLAADKKEWSKNAALLEKHIDDFSAEEYKSAVQKLKSMEELKDIKLADAKRMKEYANIGLDLLKTGIDVYSKTESALLNAENRRRANAKEERDIEEHQWKANAEKRTQEKFENDERRTQEKFENDERRTQEKHDKDIGRKIDLGDDEDSGGSTGGPNKPKDSGPSTTEDSSPRHTGNGSKETETTKDSSSSSFDDWSAGGKTSSKPSFYSRVKDSAKSAANSAKESVKSAANSAKESVKSYAKSAADSANEVARAQAHAQEQAFSSNKGSASSTSNNAKIAANFAGLAAEHYGKTAVSKVSDGAKWFSDTGKKIYEDNGGTKINEAFDQIDEWSRKTLGK